MLGEFSSFLEMIFAINVMFCTWPKPGELLTKWLIRRAQQDPGRLGGGVEGVSKRIYAFQERCEKRTPVWRWLAGLVAVGILLSQLILPAFRVDVVGWGQLILFFLTFPLIGAALDLGLRARSCMKKNREDLRPRDSQMGALNVKDIADQLTQAAIPTEDETPPDENG